LIDNDSCVLSDDHDLAAFLGDDRQPAADALANAFVGRRLQ